MIGLGAIWTMVRPFLPYIILVIALFGLYETGNHWCNAKCESVTKERDAKQEIIDAAQARATALALMWSAQVDKTEAEARASERERNAIFAVLHDEVKAMPADVAAVHFPGIAVGVLNDAYRSATSTSSSISPEATATDPGAAQGIADSSAGEVTEWGVSMYEWVAACKARVDEFTSFYNNLRSAKP